jgi:hypothetical protein
MEYICPDIERRKENEVVKARKRKMRKETRK